MDKVSHKDFMVYMSKILANVTFQGVSKTPGIVGRPLHTCMGSFMNPASVTILYKSLFIQWLNNTDYGMMNHSVTKFSRRHRSLFRLMNQEVIILAMPIDLRKQLILQGNDFFFHIRKKGRTWTLTSFAFKSFFCRSIEIFERTNLLKQVFVSLH